MDTWFKGRPNKNGYEHWVCYKQWITYTRDKNGNKLWHYHCQPLADWRERRRLSYIGTWLSFAFAAVILVLRAIKGWNLFQLKYIFWKKYIALMCVIRCLIIICMFAADNCIAKTRTEFSTSGHIQMGAWCSWSWHSPTGRSALFSVKLITHSVLCCRFIIMPFGQGSADSRIMWHLLWANTLPCAQANSASYLYGSGNE